MTANLCVESTGRHAMEEGYDVTFLYDAIGASGVPEYEVAVNVNFPLIANAVIKVEEFLEAIKENSEVPVAIKEGDTVFGSDHMEIGTVKEIVAGANGTGYFLVPRGMIFKTDTYIPLDAITKKSGENIFINIPKMVVDKMPWSEPPTQESFVQKQGPAASIVSKLYKSKDPTSHKRG